jgi:hypothetical protein
MCEPTTMMALTIASTAASVYGQQQAAKAQTRANQQTYDSQMQAYRFNQASSNFTRVQEAENLAQTRMTNDAAARRAMATARVSAGESGVTGLSVDALLADIGARAGMDNSNAETNYLRRDRAIQADAMNNWANTSSAINKLQTPTAPDYLGAALKIGTAVNNYQPSAKPKAAYETQPWGGTASNPWYG